MCVPVGCLGTLSDWAAAETQCGSRAMCCRTVERQVLLYCLCLGFVGVHCMCALLPLGLVHCDCSALAPANAAAACLHMPLLHKQVAWINWLWLALLLFVVHCACTYARLTVHQVTGAQLQPPCRSLSVPSHLWSCCRLENDGRAGIVLQSFLRVLQSFSISRLSSCCSSANIYSALRIRVVMTCEAMAWLISFAQLHLL
jgi:hypothetical protein